VSLVAYWRVHSHFGPQVPDMPLLRAGIELGLIAARDRRPNNTAPALRGNKDSGSEYWYRTPGPNLGKALMKSRGPRGCNGA